jgi:uncharacterized membrane protein
VVPAPTASLAVPPEGSPVGFPCAVREVLQTNCAGCHAGAVYIPGFNSRADLLAEQSDGRTFGQHVAERITSTERPMPPSGAERLPTSDERALISAWVESGMPGGTCGDLISP